LMLHPSKDKETKSHFRINTPHKTIFLLIILSY